MERRTFIKASLATMATTMVSPSVMAEKLAKESNPVRLGFIGCGGRGTGVISSMSRNSNMQIVAMADILQDKLDKALPVLNKLNSDKGLPGIKKSNIYCGVTAYKELLDNKEVDAVLISTPAYAHPFIFEAAVKARKHVYCEKPSAPDVYGTLQMLKASEGIQNLTMVCGFQIRYSTPFVEMVKRIHSGDIGEIVTAQLFYNSCEVPMIQTDGSEDEFRLRNHFHYLGLSGGILNDQAIHMLDVCNWVLGTRPLSAIGAGNRRKSMPFGDALTNYQVIYTYPKDINVSLQAYQMGPQFGDVCARFIGTKGWAEAHYSGGVFIKGEKNWQAENPDGLYDADPNKGRSFIESIEQKQYLNLIQDGCDSTLTALLGREAAFSGKRVFWDELIRENKRLDTGIDLLNIK